MNNSAMPVNEEEEYPACKMVIGNGRMQAAADSSKCMGQLDGLRRVADGARNSLLCAKKGCPPSAR